MPSGFRSFKARQVVWTVRFAKAIETFMPRSAGKRFMFIILEATGRYRLALRKMNRTPSLPRRSRE